MGIVSDYSGGAVPLASTQRDIARSPQRSQSQTLRAWLYTGCGLFNCAFHYNRIAVRCQTRHERSAKSPALCGTGLCLCKLS
jgi:hypothetical protein